MKKLVLVLAVALGLTACGGNSTSEVHYQAWPVELKDCKAFYVKSETYQNLTIVRCPGSTTTTQYTVSSGKTSHTYSNIVVDGVEYVKKEDESLK
jgi:ABC-type glycerol-3-phosphate transport system substrate-binding protein